jgi:hypothetical protein
MDYWFSFDWLLSWTKTVPTAIAVPTIAVVTTIITIYSLRKHRNGHNLRWLVPLGALCAIIAEFTWAMILIVAIGSVLPPG